MSASTHAVNSNEFTAPKAVRAQPAGVQPNPAVGDLVGSRLRELDQRISAADRIAIASDPQDNAGVPLGRRTPAANPSDHINDLASRVARLAEADDRTSRLSAEATASGPIAPLTAAIGNGYADKPERQTPRLADLIKLKRAEMDRYEAEASTRIVTQSLHRLAQPSRRDTPGDQFAAAAAVHRLQPATTNAGYTPAHPGQAIHLNGASHFPGSFNPAHATAPHSTVAPMAQGGLTPPTPPRAEPTRESAGAAIGARMSEIRDEGFSSSLYGFGAGLGIALMSGAALYVVLRLV